MPIPCVVARVRDRQTNRREPRGDPGSFVLSRVLEQRLREAHHAQRLAPVCNEDDIARYRHQRDGILRRLLAAQRALNRGNLDEHVVQRALHLHLRLLEARSHVTLVDFAHPRVSVHQADVMYELLYARACIHAITYFLSF